LKTISRALAVLLLPALLLSPRIDAVFSATMPRKAIAEPLLLLFCGWAASRLRRRRRTAFYAPSAVAAATLLLLFWMIPRSIDLTQIYPSANAAYVVSFFAAGFLLTEYLPYLPGVAKAAYGLYFSSMIVALGLLFTFQSTLLCSAYTLEDQHVFGKLEAFLGAIAYLLMLALTTRWLSSPPGRS
jgi:hypothetical protein